MRVKCSICLTAFCKHKFCTPRLNLPPIVENESVFANRSGLCCGLPL